MRFFCFVFLLHVYAFFSFSFFSFHVWVKSYSIYLSPSDLFHLVHGTFRVIHFVQMAGFHSFLWLSSIPLKEGNGTPLQYSCLENPMDGGAWWVAFHGVVKSWTWLSDFTFIFHLHALEKEMAIHSSVLAWRIPGTGEPGGLLSMGLHRVRHNWSDLAAAVFYYIHIYHIFFIHSPIDGHLGYFYILAIINDAAMNIRVHMSF